jgi:hypothetical protein
MKFTYSFQKVEGWSIPDSVQQLRIWWEKIIIEWQKEENLLTNGLSIKTKW